MPPRRVTVAVSIAIAVAGELMLGEYTTAFITVLFIPFMSGAVRWATAHAQGTPVTKPGGEMFERAVHARASMQGVADGLDQILGWCGVAAAAVTLLVTRNPRAAVSVVIVVACGVGASTSVAVLTALRRGAVRRALVKGGATLEALWACDTVVLASLAPCAGHDLVVRAVYPAARQSADDVLAAAALAERPSPHPIGRAIVRSATERALAVGEPDGFSYIPGSGIRALSNGEEILVGNCAFVTQGRLPDTLGDPSSTVFVMRGGRYLGALSLAKQLRPDAKRAIAALKSLGMKAHLLTGDSRIATELIARALVVDRFESELGPAQRLQRVRDLDVKRGVVVVGDAIEDAAALEAAALGVATGSATAVAPSNAGVLILGDDLEPFIAVMGLARNAHRIILVNLTGTLLVDAAGVALSTMGMLSPLAALLMRAGVELAGLLNASRVAVDGSADGAAG